MKASKYNTKNIINELNKLRKKHNIEKIYIAKKLKKDWYTIHRFFKAKSGLSLARYIEIINIINQKLEEKGVEERIFPLYVEKNE